MTRVIYEPAIPAMCFSGHAGAGDWGQDPVCAALSILMYTLAAEEARFPAAAAPGDRPPVEWGEGRCRVSGGDRRAYEVVLAGVRLLAREYPRYVYLEERYAE